MSQDDTTWQNRPENLRESERFSIDKIGGAGKILRFDKQAHQYNSVTNSQLTAWAVGITGSIEDFLLLKKRIEHFNGIHRPDLSGVDAIIYLHSKDPSLEYR